jgi:RHS repeat-associated protein
MNRIAMVDQARIGAALAAQRLASAFAMFWLWCAFALALAGVPVQAQAQSSASFVSQRVPAQMSAGRSYTVSVTMLNNGTSTWSETSKFRLGSQNPQDNPIWGIGRVLLDPKAQVAPNQQRTFTFVVKAPTAAGNYNFQWQMLQEGVTWFGAQTPTVSVKVSVGAPAWPAPVTPLPPPPKSITRTTAYEYDAATGLLTKEIVEPDNTQLRIDTSYPIANYDAYGNRTLTTVSSPATGTAAIAARSSSSAYGARGRFVASRSNEMGHSETRAFDARFGTPTSLTGPNQLSTTWRYDNFGRKINETRADGTQTKWDYLYCSGTNGGTAACPAAAKYAVMMTPLLPGGSTASGSWVTTFYDAFDRVVEIQTLGFDGSSVIRSITSYDRDGNIFKTSRPHYTTQSPALTTFYYDILGRITSAVQPDGKQTSFGYNGLSTTTTNALGQTRTFTKDIIGRLIKVQDADLAKGTLSYTYDPFDNLSSTTDAKGNVVSIAYNSRGHKLRLVDPDLGSWTYASDVLGETVRQTDAKNQVTTVSYDKLGRMTSRSENDLVSSWTYDSCTKGVGKVCRSTANNGYASTNGYDAFGRLATVSTTIDTAYTESLSYDSAGRLATQTYPTGFTVKYVYTTLGYLKEVRNNATNALYWRANAQDAEGHTLQQTYGNNIVTQQVFDTNNGRLKNIYAGAGNSVQNLTFTYDDVGSLLGRSDTNQKLGENFTYDALRRLSTSTVNSSGAGIVTQTYEYDSIGNITFRSDKGTYTSGSLNARPHAIDNIALAGGGTRYYNYDANGNLTGEVQYDAANNLVAAKGRTTSYTSFNMPATISAAGASLTFSYGPGHQRTKLVGPSGTTIFVHPDNAGSLAYEKEIKPDLSVVNKFYVSAGDEVVALVKQGASGTTATYLHHDNLGSVTALTNEAGSVIERMAYEPFGKRRSAAGALDPDNLLKGVNTDRGYEEHEHLDGLGLIHMNGRVYDPAIGRFTTADPGVPHPEDMQSYNRYAYTRNNPLAYVDPSGFDDQDRWVPQTPVSWYTNEPNWWPANPNGSPWNFTFNLSWGSSSGGRSYWQGSGSARTGTLPRLSDGVPGFDWANGGSVKSGALVAGTAISLPGAAGGANLTEIPWLSAIRGLAVRTVIGSTLLLRGDSAQDDKDKIRVYRGSNLVAEAQIFEETSLIMSDATRRAYVESGGSLTEAYVAGEKRHAELVAKYGGENALAAVQTRSGSEFPSAPRSMFSVTTNLAVAQRFAGPGGVVYYADIDRKGMIKSPVSTSAEYEYFIRNMMLFKVMK